jgi:hypothetical protein
MSEDKQMASELIGEHKAIRKASGGQTLTVYVAYRESIVFV